MMKGIRLFALLLAFTFAVSCQEDVEEPLQGTWDISWTDERGTLAGIIEFKGEHALIKAFGSPASPFLHHYQERTFSWQFDAEGLLLAPRENELTLRYRLVSRSDNYLKFDHLDGITVILRRR